MKVKSVTVYTSEAVKAKLMAIANTSRYSDTTKKLVSEGLSLVWAEDFKKQSREVEMRLFFTEDDLKSLIASIPYAQYRTRGTRGYYLGLALMKSLEQQYPEVIEEVETPNDLKVTLETIRELCDKALKELN